MVYARSPQRASMRAAMPAHVPLERLLEVAADDAATFTLEEFNHLKDCADCFNQWSDFVKARPEHG